MLGFATLMLPATDRDDNFNRVAVGKFDSRKPAARHDFAIAFHGNAFALEPEVLDQIHDPDRRFELPVIAVYTESNHVFTYRNVLKSRPSIYYSTGWK